MRSEIFIDTKRQEDLRGVLDPSLEQQGRVKTSIETAEEGVKIVSRTDTLGQLRGSTDSIFRLSSLAKKILEE